MSAPEALAQGDVLEGLPGTSVAYRVTSVGGSREDPRRYVVARTEKGHARTFDLAGVELIEAGHYRGAVHWRPRRP